MILQTKYNFGDKIFVTLPGTVEGPYTIGHIRAAITNSSGVSGETIFDNYKAQKTELLVQYMCVETGIGTGTLWNEKHCFDDFNDALETIGG